MYYSVNENGELISSETSDILPEEYQEIFPSEAPKNDFEDKDNDNGSLTGSGNSVVISTPDGTIVANDGSDINVITPDIDYQQLGQAVADSISYDDLIDALADVPSYTVYPNTSAVAVLEKVVDSIDGKFGYVVVSGSTNYETLLYYSRSYDVNGKNIVLHSPVTYCRYYQYRPSSSSNWIYTYTVNNVSEVSFALNNQLAYTNLIDGYPDLVPYKSKESYQLFYVLVIVIMFYVLIKFTFGRIVKGGE